MGRGGRLYAQADPVRALVREYAVNLSVVDKLIEGMLREDARRIIAHMFVQYGAAVEIIG